MNGLADAAEHAITLGAWLQANDPERRRPCPWCPAPDAMHNHDRCSFRPAGAASTPTRRSMADRWGIR